MPVCVIVFYIWFQQNPWGRVLGGVIAALGVGATQPSLQAMCMQTEVPLKRSVASNTIYVGMDSGLFLGPF